MRLLLRVWRQRRADQPGEFAEYAVPDAAPDMTVLELLDRLNEDLAERVFKEALQNYLDDNCNAWELDANGEIISSGPLDRIFLPSNTVSAPSPTSFIQMFINLNVEDDVGDIGA